MASRSASVMPVSRPLMRTNRRGRCLAAPVRLRNSSAAARAAGLRSGTIESSKSEDHGARPRSPVPCRAWSPRRRERKEESACTGPCWVSRFSAPKYRSGARFWRRNYRGLVGFEPRWRYRPCISEVSQRFRQLSSLPVPQPQWRKHRHNSRCLQPPRSTAPTTSTSSAIKITRRCSSSRPPA